MAFFKNPFERKHPSTAEPIDSASVKAKLPPITDDARNEARRNPGGWVYALKPGSDPIGRVPPEAVVGAWKVSDSGEIMGEFLPNPNFKP